VALVALVAVDRDRLVQAQRQPEQQTQVAAVAVNLVLLTVVQAVAVEYL
jgi:hypothetical protein